MWSRKDELSLAANQCFPARNRVSNRRPRPQIVSSAPRPGRPVQCRTGALSKGRRSPGRVEAGHDVPIIAPGSCPRTSWDLEKFLKLSGSLAVTAHGDDMDAVDAV
jgi:hypothetical protein